MQAQNESKLNMLDKHCFLADGAGSIAASVRLEQALSDEAASASVKMSVPVVLALQAKLWLAIGKFIKPLVLCSSSDCFLPLMSILFLPDACGQVNHDYSLRQK